MRLDKSGDAPGPIAWGGEAQHGRQIPRELLQPADVADMAGAVIVGGDGGDSHGLRGVFRPCHELRDETR